MNFFFLAIWWAGYFFPFFSHKLSITFVLHAIFFFRQALAGNFFQNHPPLPLPSSRVKWSAPNCDALIQAVLNYKCNHFLTYVKSNDFLHLDVGKVKELACLDDLHITKEEEVYEAVIEWVKHDLTSRECFLPDLLNWAVLSVKIQFGEVFKERRVDRQESCLFKHLV